MTRGVRGSSGMDWKGFGTSMLDDEELCGREAVTSAVKSSAKGLVVAVISCGGLLEKVTVLVAPADGACARLGGTGGACCYVGMQE